MCHYGKNGGYGGNRGGGGFTLRTIEGSPWSPHTSCTQCCRQKFHQGGGGGGGGGEFGAWNKRGQKLNSTEKMWAAVYLFGLPNKWFESEDFLKVLNVYTAV